MTKMLLAVVDEDNKIIYVEKDGIVYKYDLGMYHAALLNPKYWDDAEIGSVDKSIPELVGTF